MNEKKILTIPNILSFYRLASFPLVLYLALDHQEKTFVVLLIINLVTDALDGLIARMFNQKSEIGARLDSVADLGTFILAITGIFIFKIAEFSPHMTSFLILIGLFFSTDLLSLIKFKRVSSLHLYSWKIGGYILGSFFLVLFTIGFFPAFYYLLLWWGILSSLENILVQLILSEMKSNQKGLYWVLKNQRMSDRISKNCGSITK